MDYTLGPMVYGIAYCPLDKKDELKALGVDDSKKLTADQRDGHLEQLRESAAWLGWTVHVLTPQDISRAMMRRYGWSVSKWSRLSQTH